MTSESIVQVVSSQDENNIAFGSGFVIHIDESAKNAYIVTCAHVVHDVGGIDCVKVAGSAAEVIAIGGPNGTGTDIAVLKVPLDQSMTAVVLEFNHSDFLRVRIPGAQRHTPNQIVIKTLLASLKRYVEFVDLRTGNRTSGWEFLTTDEQYVAPGFSGGPVINSASGRVVGIVISRSDEGRKGSAVGIDQLELLLPNLPEVVRKQIKSLRLSQQADPASGKTDAENLYPNQYNDALNRVAHNRIIPIVGAAGYGKSTFIQNLADDHRIIALFPDGIFSLPIGPDLEGDQIASRINGLTKLISGTEHDDTDPVIAMHSLTSAVSGRNILLLFDDVWTDEWKILLKIASRSCPVVATSRQESLFEPTWQPIRLTQPDQDALAKGLSESLIGLSDTNAIRLVAAAESWPFAVRFIASYLHQERETGRELNAAANDMSDMLRDSSTLDQVTSDGTFIEKMSEKLLHYSFYRLTAVMQNRLSLLSLFRSNTELPISIIAAQWGENESATRTALFDLKQHSFVKEINFTNNRYTILLHDLVLSFLRRTFQEKLRSMHSDFLYRNYNIDVSADLDHDVVADATEGDSYADDNLMWHLAHSLDSEIIIDLILSPSYVSRRVRSGGAAKLAADAAFAPSDFDGRLQVWHDIRAFLPSLMALGDSHAAARALDSYLDKDGIGPFRFLERLDKGNTHHGHPGSVLSVRISCDESFITTGCSDGRARIFRSDTLELIYTSPENSGWIRATALLPNSSLLLVGSDDGLIRLWDWQNDKLVTVFVGHTAAIRDLYIGSSGKCFASASDDGNVFFWDLQAGLVRQKFAVEGSRSKMRSVAISPDESWIAAGGDDCSLHIWNTEEEFLPGVLQEHSQRIRSCRFSPSGMRLVSCSDDGSAVIYNLASRKVEKSIGGEGAVARAAQFIGDDKIVVAYAESAKLVIYDLNETSDSTQLCSHSRWVMACDVSESRTWMASGSDDAGLVTWTLPEGDVRAVLSGENEWVWSVTVSKNAQKVYACTTTGRILCFSSDELGNYLISSQEKLPVALRGIALNCEDNRLLCAGDSNEMFIVDALTLQCIDTFASESGSLRRCSATAHEKIAVCSLEGKVEIFDRITLHRLNSFDCESGAAYEAHLTSAGNIIVSHRSGSVSLSNNQGEELWTRQSHVGAALTISVDPCDFYYATGGDDGVISLWDYTSSGPIATTKGHLDWVSQCAFSPSGQLLASVSDDHTLRVWGIPELDPIFETAFGQPVYGLCWHPNNSRLFVVGASGVMDVTI